MKTLLLLLSVGILVGCSSNLPQKNYYLLNSHYNATQQIETQTVADFIWITPVNIANFLNKDGLVYQTGEYQYVTATNNLWASPLAAQLQDMVVNDMSILLPNRLVSAAPMTTPKATIKLFIEGFHGTYQGDVIIKGYWIIIDDKGEMQRKNFDYKLPQTSDGYTAVVEVLSQGWHDEMQDLVKKIKF